MRSMQADPLESPFLTTAEVARFFRRSNRTVARWARDGALSATRTPGGRQLLFRREEVLAFRPESQEQQA